MSELIDSAEFDPVERVAQLSYLSASYANQQMVAERLESDSVAGLKASIQRIGEEALTLQEHYGISEEDFFEAVF